MPPDDADLLDDLNGDDPERRDRAWARIRAEACAFAEAIVPRHEQAVDLQPESIVHSVLHPAVQKAASTCATDRDFREYVKQCVRNRMRDRLRRRKGPGRLGEDLGEHADVTPDRDAPGPATRVRSIEDERLDEIGYRRLMAAFDTAPISERDRLIVELFVVRSRQWDEVARTLGMERNAAKTAMSRLRARLLPHVVEPALGHLEARDAIVARRLMLENRRSAEVAQELGVLPDDVRAIFARHVLPALVSVYGHRGAELLRHLLRQRPDSSGQAGQAPSDGA